MKRLLAIIIFSFLLVFVSGSAAQGVAKEGHLRLAAEQFADSSKATKSASSKKRHSEARKAPNTVSSSELVEKNRFFNDKTVWYQGEVIGDIMVRGKFAWFTVNDDAYSRQANQIKLKGYNSGLPLVAPKRLSQQIKFVGNYNKRGDIVLVKAVFHNACPEHNGVLMLHAQSLKVIKRGFVIKHKVSTFKLRLAAFSFLFFLLSAAVYYLRMPAFKRHWFAKS